LVKDGYKFASAPIALGVLALIFGQHVLAPQIVGVIFLFFGGFILYFFRDPHRVIPADPLAVVSPADGTVLEVVPEQLGERQGRRITVFLAIWNVHVNRSPMDGEITKVDYRPGRFYMAMKQTASVENEQNVIYLDTAQGEIVFKQIAGFIARRVILWKSAGQRVNRGERIGLVRFGSRADIWLPLEADVVVKAGDRVAGGSSVIARWRQKD
jgi:phosphatidylserine decarboxylase